MLVYRDSDDEDTLHIVWSPNFCFTKFRRFSVISHLHLAWRSTSGSDL